MNAKHNSSNYPLFLELLETGFQRALEVYNTFTGHVCFAKKSAEQEVLKEIDATLTDSNQPLYVVITNIMGQGKGRNLLIISEPEMMRLQAIAGEHMATQPGEITNAFMLEIGNIVAAAAITVYANKSGKFILGSAPQIKRVNANNLPELFLAADASYTQQHFWHFSSGKQVGAWCVWLFEESIDQVLITKADTVAL